MDEYSKGDKVLAKLSGTQNYQEVKVVSGEDGFYTVRITGGLEQRVSAKNMKAVKKTSYRKSPARNEKSPSRKSPARKTSPARKASPSRKMPSSPAKRPKSPSRKSPGRTKSKDREIKKTPSPARSKEPKEKEATPIKRASRRSEIPVSITDSVLEVQSEKPKASVRGRKRAIKNIEILDEDTDENLDKEEEIAATSTLIRRSARISQQERVLHMKPNYESTVEKLTEFSDEDDLIKSEAASKKSSKTSPPTEFGGTIGALLLFDISILLPLYALAFCNERVCSFTKVPDLLKYKQLSTYLNVPAAASSLGLVILISLLSSLPIGGRKITGPPSKNGRLEYITNGLFCYIVTLICIGGLLYYKIPIVSIIVDNHFQHTVVALIVSLVLTIGLHIRSFYQPVSTLNPFGTIGSGLYNFVAGREVNPRIGKWLDIKLLLLRVAVIKVLLTNAAFLYKGITLTPQMTNETIIYNWKSIGVSPTLLAISVMQSIYSLDVLIFEAQWPFSFEMQYEGCGAMLILGYIATYPALFPAITKYVYDYKIELPVWQLAITCLVYIVGLYILRASNSQKNAYRKNPYDPKLAHLETIPTSQGKSLLVSGWWGRVRHPNYLGDIIINSAIISFAWNTPSALLCYVIIGYLIHRAHRDGKRCKQRYGAAWERYCQRVKYALIPKIY